MGQTPGPSRSRHHIRRWELGKGALGERRQGESAREHPPASLPPQRRRGGLALALPLPGMPRAGVLSTTQRSPASGPLHPPVPRPHARESETRTLSSPRKGSLSELSPSFNLFLKQAQEGERFTYVHVGRPAESWDQSPPLLYPAAPEPHQNYSSKRSYTPGCFKLFKYSDKSIYIRNTLIISHFQMRKHTER